ncbi:MAG TPA: hypothetical protein VN086_00840 [Candidatus Paceibacterota bacterium]|nr:hypothetical protein [Candidatus Paceibacterota bacterium]
MPALAVRNPPTRVIVAVAAIWFASDIGYYLIRSLIGRDSSYSANPFTLAAYYLFWVCVAFIAFWNLYKKWRMVTFDLSMIGIIALIAFLVAGYITFIFPNFAPIHWLSYIKPPPEIFTASPWYFLPKSIEIILQQLLVAAMVLALDARGYTMREVADWSATLFGGAHLALVFGQTFAYMVFFTLCATVAGFIFPYLLLRVKNGFLYTYTLHWTFYAVIIILIRVLYVH